MPRSPGHPSLHTPRAGRGCTPPPGPGAELGAESQQPWPSHQPSPAPAAPGRCQGLGCIFARGKPRCDGYAVRDGCFIALRPLVLLLTNWLCSPQTSHPLTGAAAASPGDELRRTLPKSTVQQLSSWCLKMDSFRGSNPTSPSPAAGSDVLRTTEPLALSPAASPLCRGDITKLRRAARTRSCCRPSLRPKHHQ